MHVQMVNSETMIPDLKPLILARLVQVTKKKISPRALFPSVLVKTKLPQDPSIDHIKLWLHSSSINWRSSSGVSPRTAAVRVWILSVSN